MFRKEYTNTRVEKLHQSNWSKNWKLVIYCKSNSLFLDLYSIFIFSSFLNVKLRIEREFSSNRNFFHKYAHFSAMMYRTIHSKNSLFDPNNVICCNESYEDKKLERKIFLLQLFVHTSLSSNYWFYFVGICNTLSPPPLSVTKKKKLLKCVT